MPFVTGACVVGAVVGAVPVVGAVVGAPSFLGSGGATLAKNA